MAAEFYQKTSGLFEEFKRRELHFLNAQASADYNKRSNGGAQLQDYLRKVSETEKSNEKFYSSIMKNMQSFDEDLSSLQTSLDGLTIPGHFAKYGNITSATQLPSQSYRDSNMSQSPSKSLNTQTVSTQTDFVFCDHCRSPLTPTTTFNPIFKNPSEPREASAIDKDKHIVRTNSQNVGVFHLNAPNSSNDAKVQNGSKSVNFSPTEKEEIYINKGNENTKANKLINEGQSDLFANKMSPQTSKSQQQTSSIDNTRTRKEMDHADVGVDKRKIGEETITHVKADTATSTKLDTAINDDIETAKNVVTDEGKKVKAPIRPPRKHDGSVNKEFDFLEEDDDAEKNGKESATNARVKEWLKGVDLSPGEIPNPGVVQGDMKRNQTGVKDIQSTSDDSSSSEDVPVTKPVPVVETEAYKSLLLGINAQVKDSKAASGSDSDDEIETALKLKAARTAASKSAPSKITFLPSDMKKSTVTEQKKKTGVEIDSDNVEQASQAKSAVSKDKSSGNTPFDSKNKVQNESDAKQNLRSSKTAARPQSKLAKQTRKVLGLGSSSSSEANADIAQKPTKDNNSDEFSFFD